MSAYRDMMVRLGATQWFSDLTRTTLVPIDRFLYRRSGGRVSLMHFGRGAALPTLLLTTTGRRSGRPRTTPVLYLDEAGTPVVVASNFGEPRHPLWSENLLADPLAAIQIRGEHRNVRARLADEQELAALWPRLLELYPSWEAYRGRTDRSFRAFFLERA